MLLLATIGWAWCCLGIFFAHLARRNKAVVPVVDTLKGKYLEAGVSAMHDLAWVE